MAQEQVDTVHFDVYRYNYNKVKKTFPERLKGVELKVIREVIGIISFHQSFCTLCYPVTYIIFKYYNILRRPMLILIF